MSERYYTEDLLIENIYQPYPLRRRAPLSVTHPELALEWLYKKNCGYGPDDFSYGSNVKVWWQCQKKKKHSWQASIGNRTSEEATGCPLCVAETYGLDLTEYPEALPFFDEKQNEGIEPSKIPVGDGVWWKCDEAKDHRWHGPLNINVLDEFCPFCRGHKVSKTNSLALFPDIAKQWDRTKNGLVKPKDVVPGSKKKYWFKCAEGPDHEFEQSPYARTVRGDGCPFCSKRRFCKSRSLAVTHPKVARELHPEKNGKLKASEITPAHKEKVWWLCKKGPDHEWPTSVDDRVRGGSGCPFCANRQVSVTNSLANLFPDIAKEFDREKNAPETPKTVCAFSAAEFWWKCKKNHEWLRAVYLRTKRGSRCPECPKPQKAVARSLKEMFPEIAKHLHPTKNRGLNPDEVSYASKEYVWWHCPNGPEHQWQQLIQNMTSKGYQCPFCEGYRVSETNNLKALFPALAIEWHKTKNSQKPQDVLPGSAYKAWWRCGVCAHEWDRECYLRTRRKSACPSCRNYPE